jgi:hypothetical protein
LDKLLEKTLNIKLKAVLSAQNGNDRKGSNMVTIAHAAENMYLLQQNFNLDHDFGLDMSILLLEKKSCTTL